MWQPLPLLALLLLGVACEGSQGAPAASGRHLLDAPLPQDSTFTKQEGNGSDEARLIPGSLIGGQPLGPPLEGVAADDACSSACRADPQCRWFAYCDLPGGCKAANGAQPLAYQDCQLLTGNCSLHMSVTPFDGITSGFPVRLDSTMQISGFVQFPGQGIEGGDMQCPESLDPGTCSFRSPLAAAATCIRTPACRAVVVFPNGTDGCSAQPVALLKTAGLNPVGAFVSDKVYTLQVSKYQSEESSFWLTASEGNVLLPSPSELAAGDEALASADAWKGCVWGANAMYDGDVVDTLDGVASPEECCRACHARQARCTVWNWCDPAVAVKGTCFYQDTTLTRETVLLNASQCQLRYQELAVPEVGTPPVLLAKGPAVPFAAGAPMNAWAPEQPGFQRFIGRSLFAWGQYPCEGSLRPQAGECLLQAPIDQLASECAANDTCVALLFKPGGIINGTAQLASLAYFKSDANPARWILSPTTVLFVEDAVAAGSSAGSTSGSSSSGGSSSGSSSSGLSGGAIAGIVVGAVALAVVAVAAAWAAMRRRRTAADAAAAAEDGKRPGTGSLGSKAAWQGGPNGGGSTTQLASVAHEQLPSSGDEAMQSPFGLVSAAAVGATESRSNSSRSSGLPPTVQAQQQGSAPVRRSSGTLLQRVVPLCSSSAQQQQQPSRSPLPAHHHSAPPPQPSTHLSGGGPLGKPAGKQVRHSSTPVRPISHPHTPARFGSNGRILEGQALGSSALPSAMLSAGLSAALPPGSSVASTAHGMSSGRTQASANPHGSSNSGPDVLVELMGHVASRDVAQQTCSLPRSTDASEPGQWMVEHLPPRLQEWMVDPDSIEYLRWPNGKLMELGQGASAHVYKALYNGEVVACKEIDLEQSEEMQEAFVTEATRLHALRHPNVISFYGICVANGKGIVLMEFAEGRDLHSALQVKAVGSDQRLFSWQRRGRRVAFELAKAVNYLHSKDIIHFDLKSQNVLLTATGSVRLSDVGFSRLKEKTFITHVPLIGTFAWIAPEVLLGRAQVDQAADIFSLGVVMWEIVTGERPQRGSLRMPCVPEECPQEVSDLIMQCLSEEPCERPTAAQLLKTLSGMLERSRAVAHSMHRAAAADASAHEQTSPPISPRAG